jgi:DNA-binding response OmpR family regulator
MSILVVDDNTLLLSKIVRSLVRTNREVRTASSLTEAREHLKNYTPEVICLDLQLPDGNGMDLLEEIRSHSRKLQGRKVPVIIISGHYSDENRRRAEQLGVSGFFSKPFVLQDLHKLLDKLLPRNEESVADEQLFDDSVDQEIVVDNGFEPLGRERVARAKCAYTTRRVNLEDATQLRVADYRPQAGDLVLARVTKRVQHTHLQLTTGRRAMMNVGDEIIVAYGNRYAPDQFESEVPRDLGRCHLVAAGGVASYMLSRNKSMKAATSIQPIGVLANSEGKAINMRDYAVEHGQVPAQRPHITVVLGTSMNAGKTTVAADTILGMTRQGLRVGAAKVTGTGAGGDTFRMIDSGAVSVYDFTDAGFASTYKVSLMGCIEIMETLVARLCEDQVDSIVIEVADGILQEETRGLLLSPAFQDMADDVIFAAGDAMGAISGVEWLLSKGLNVAAVSGCLTSAPLAVREFSKYSDVPVYGRDDLKSASFVGGRLNYNVHTEDELMQVPVFAESQRA